MLETATPERSSGSATAYDLFFVQIMLISPCSFIDFLQFSLGNVLFESLNI